MDFSNRAGSPHLGGRDAQHHFDGKCLKARLPRPFRRIGSSIIPIHLLLAFVLFAVVRCHE
jgi:hypothetical protein